MAQPTIMVIDEADEHRDILGRLLRSAGYAVVEAQPGDEAVAAAERHTPSLVLLEVAMPGHPAWETARQLRQALAQTPIVGTTVLTALLSRRRLQRLGFADCIDKPFDIDALMRCVRALVA